jgi:hypothetical protein
VPSVVAGGLSGRWKGMGGWVMEGLSERGMGDGGWVDGMGGWGG